VGESLSLSSISGLMSTNPEALVGGIVNAALMGFKVYVNAGALERLKPYFDELGIEAREVPGGVIMEASYILISLEGQSVVVKVVDGGKEHTRTFRLEKIVAALESYIEKRRGAKERPKLYELLVSEDLKRKLSKLGGGE